MRNNVGNCKPLKNLYDVTIAAVCGHAVSALVRLRFFWVQVLYSIGPYLFTYCLLIYLLTHLLTYLLTYFLTYLLILTHLLTHSLTYLVTHVLTYSLTSFLTSSLILPHFLTHSLTHLLISWERENKVCEYFWHLSPQNAFWLSLGVIAVFSVITMILCVRLAKHYRRALRSSRVQKIGMYGVPLTLFANSPEHSRRSDTTG